jgi:hypothetical protein
MLSDATIDRYSRQIIVPEIGARGQVRILSARVLLSGAGDAAAAAATILGRAGVGRVLALDGALATEPLGPDARLVPVDRDDGGADVVVDLAGRGTPLARRGRPHVLAAAAGDTVLIATLVGRPCAACAALGGPKGSPRDGVTSGAGPPALRPAPALALAAVAAAEALRVLVAAPTTGRLQRLGPDAGALVADPLPAGPGCAICG